MAWLDFLRETVSHPNVRWESAPDGQLQARIGSGPRAQTCALTTSALEAAFGDPDLQSMTTTRGSALRGLLALLQAPRAHGLENEAFTDVAGRLVVTIEGPGFSAGHALLGGDEPWVRPFGDGLVLAYAVEMDQGYVTLTRAQVERWGVSGERIEKAALSALFYRTGFGEPEDVSDAPGVTTYRLGDGFDAARALVLEMIDYPRARKGMVLSLPTAETLLFADDEPAHRDALRTCTRRCLESAEAPLSRAIFQIREGRLVLEPAEHV